MIITMLVLDESVKKGKSSRTQKDYDMHTIRGVDFDEEKTDRCKSLLLVQLGEQDRALRGTLDGQTVRVVIEELGEQYMGAFQCRGRIVRA